MKYERLTTENGSCQLSVAGAGSSSSMVWSRRSVPPWMVTSVDPQAGQAMISSGISLRGTALPAGKLRCRVA
jgi:hypothetical protein